MAVSEKSKANLKPFVKNDPRINRKGTPSSAAVLRKFIQQIGAETIKLPAKEGEAGAEVTRIYALIRAMYSSKAPADRAAILKAIAPGILRDELDITGKALELKVFNYDNSIARIAPGSAEDNQASSEDQGSEHGTALGQDVHGGDAGDQ